MKKATIIGATGFGGLGLIEMLMRHPNLSIKQLIAQGDVNIPVSKIFPGLTGIYDKIVEPAENIDYDTDIVFFSTPDRTGMEMVNEYLKRDIPVIDFSGDFRFQTTDDYTVYAKNRGFEETHLAPELLKEAVYGLPEKNREALRKAKLVGNPGCFAITMILGLLPAVEAGLIASDTIMCDGKSGVSGAGINSGAANLYPQRYENINTYREGHHQHLVEVEKIINLHGGGHKKIFFVPQVIPMTRGILVNMYADVSKNLDTKDLQAVYKDYYANEPFVTVTERSPNTSDVKGSNRCEIRPMIDKRTGKLLITSVIDNLMKGQSGNAIQVANIMMGFEETTALPMTAFFP